MKYYFLVLLISTSFIANCQNRNSIWIFGDSAGIDFSNLSNPVPINSGMDGRGSCISIADTNGNLLFYSFTNAATYRSTVIMNNMNNIISNGDTIVGAAWYNELQIIPFTTDSSKYFLFSSGLSLNNNQGLFYSIIDMSLNNGDGGVVLKNIQVNPNPIADCLTSVIHGNGRDFWVIGKLSDANTSYNRFYKYLIAEDSITNFSYQDFNDAIDNGFQKIIWASSNEKFMLINPGGYMSEFNFDRCTGNISLVRNIFPQQSSNYNRLLWDGAYSPDGNIFYVSTNYWFNVDSAYLLQLNLNATNIAASIDTLNISTIPLSTGAVRLAPDNKIYFTQWYLCNVQPFCYPYPDSIRNVYNENLSVIVSPDSLGSACNYQPFSFYLGGKRTYAGLPNNPNYDLGPSVGSVCDTLTVGITNNEQGILDLEMDVHYNAGSQFAYINAKHLKGRGVGLWVYDVTGRLIHQSSKRIYNDYFTCELIMQQYAKGLYIVSLQTEKERLVKKFVKH